MFWDGEVIALLMNNNLNVAMVGSTLVEPWHLSGVLVHSDITDLMALGGHVDQKKMHSKVFWDVDCCECIKGCLSVSNE